MDEQPQQYDTDRGGREDLADERLDDQPQDATYHDARQRASPSRSPEALLERHCEADCE